MAACLLGGGEIFTEQTQGTYPEEINLIDLFIWLSKGKWLILICIVLFSTVMYQYEKHTYVPSFTATASMVVNAKAKPYIGPDGTAQVTVNDVTLARNLVATYTEIMKSSRVMRYVLEDLKLDMPEERLRSFVKLTSLKDTQLLYLQVTCPDSFLAMRVANSIMRVAPQAMMETVEIGSINVLDYAMLPAHADPSNTLKNSAMAALVGLVLGCGMVVAYNMLAPKIDTSKDIEAGLSLKTLEEIPHIKKSPSRQSLLLTSKQVKAEHFYAESYMRLCIAVQHLCMKNRTKKIIITSSIPHEGKTTAAANLAISLARSGRSVLLVDADYHHPMVHKVFGVKWVHHHGEDGADLVLDVTQMNWDIYTLPNGIDVMGSAGKDHRFISSALSERVAAVQEFYEYIIFDTPPAGLVSDPMKLSQIVDGAIVIVKQRACRRSVLQKTVANLQKAEIHILGCVLNDARHSLMGKHYYGKYKEYYQKTAV